MSLSVQPAQAEVQTNIKVPVTIGVFIPARQAGREEWFSSLAIYTFCSVSLWTKQAEST